MRDETFWEFRRRIKGRKKKGMKNKEGKIIVDSEEVKGIYRNFYEELFEKPKWSDGEQVLRKKVEDRIRDIKFEGIVQEKLVVTEEEVRQVIKKLKKKKAGDHEGWKNELIVAGGCEMVKSLAVLFNKLLENLVVPKQWEYMTIISIYKNKGKITEMKNRRGIFLTSVIGKVFEKVVLRKIEGDIKLGTFQNGGRKERSTKDNILGVMAVIDRKNYNNKETCLIFADAEKCFAKPWLEDCLVDIVKPGLREREALHMYTLNEKARIKIDTPFGETGRLLWKIL